MCPSCQVLITNSPTVTVLMNNSSFLSQIQSQTQNRYEQDLQRSVLESCALLQAAIAHLPSRTLLRDSFQRTKGARFQSTWPPLPERFTNLVLKKGWRE